MNTKAGPVNIALKVLFTLMYGLPILRIVQTSFTSSADVFNAQSNLFFRPTLQAYVNNLDASLFIALRQSVIIATGTTVLVLLVAVPAAYGLARVRGHVATIGLGLLVVLQTLPQTAQIIPLFQILGMWGLLDTIVGVVLANAALLAPFATLLLRPFFRSVPIALEEAGAIDGAGMFRQFASIALPIARNGILTVSSITFLLAWGEFLYSVRFLLTPANRPLSVLLAMQVSAFGIDWPGLMALAVLTSLPILAVFLLTYRLLRDGLTVGAVK
ncbi:carbohydrate ABC transporter permease [Xylanimonas ulmi]|uniref:Carbohydrate ABC transporter membrane protein 2 (CUT1 family) n=1 Tax=Xylanimonas ulmi TaxID=228973 RepID=A0A4Q7M923_9MICO|nr:carbohydrate ABC transporter permease [Xylanibacterium ulmi]RZS62689.1 carbohydrate ABC transporter membrane protein 2 (CUT1 family) [Xylanibacterium ulmi]